MARNSFDGGSSIRPKRLLSVIILATAFSSAAPVAFAAQSSTIFVATVAELYTAVNDPTNAGATVVLAAGTYTLSAAISPGTKGLLDLQFDMSLAGIEGDAGAVTIDASALPPSSFTFKIGRTGIIRTGRGANAIEWLTVNGNPAAAAAISTDLVHTDLAGNVMPTTIRVAHVVASGGILHGSAGVIAFRKPLMTELVWVDRAGNSEALAAPPGTYVKFSIAPDGRRTAAARLHPPHGHERRLGLRRGPRNPGDKQSRLGQRPSVVRGRAAYCVQLTPWRSVADLSPRGDGGGPGGAAARQRRPGDASPGPAVDTYRLRFAPGAAAIRCRETRTYAPNPAGAYWWVLSKRRAPVS